MLQARVKPDETEPEHCIMTGIVSRLLAGLSLTLRQPLYSFCDVETTHGDALVTKHSDYVSVVRVDGMRRMSTRQDVARIATAQRLELSGSLETPRPRHRRLVRVRSRAGPCRD